MRPLIEEAWSLVGIDEKAAAVGFENSVAAGHAVNGNPDRLIQVFVNLLRNALYSIEPGVRSKCTRRRGPAKQSALDSRQSGR